jgi:hypothetical protein
VQIPGATGQTYTLTKADARTALARSLASEFFRAPSIRLQPRTPVQPSPISILAN